MSERGFRGWIRYGVPGLAVGLGIAWGFGERGPMVLAQAPGGSSIPLPATAAERGRPSTLPPSANLPSTDASGGTIAMTASAGGSAQLLYLIDTRTRAFAIYRIDPSNSKGVVKLEAARQYQWDLKLAEYNNQPPEVAAIESTVRSLGQPHR